MGEEQSPNELTEVPSNVVEKVLIWLARGISLFLELVENMILYPRLFGWRKRVAPLARSRASPTADCRQGVPVVEPQNSLAMARWSLAERQVDGICGGSSGAIRYYHPSVSTSRMVL